MQRLKGTETESFMEWVAEAVLVARPPSGIIFDAATFAPKVIKDGSEQVVLTHIHLGPTSLMLLAAGMLVARRRRRRSAPRDPRSGCMDCVR